MGRAKRGRIARRNCCAPRRYVPAIELLEDRTVPAGPTSSTVQFDVRSVFNADVIINQSAAGIDTTQNPVNVANQAYMTQNAAEELGNGDISINGLPDDGFYSSDYYHPDVQLAYSDLDDGLNARRADSTSGLSAFDFTVGVPTGAYSAVHVFLAAADIDVSYATANVTLTYTDQTTDSKSINIYDWMRSYSEDAGPGGYNLITGLDRNLVDGSSYDNSSDASIFGFTIYANSQRQLQSITIDSVEMPNGTGSLVFFGATGVLAPTVVLSGPSAIKAGEEYTLNLDYLGLGERQSMTMSIDWGDGTIDDFDDLPATATHVYQTTPSLNIISAVLDPGEANYASYNTLAVSVPTFDISGSGSVLVNQAYTLNLQYTPGEAQSSVSQIIVNWGDGTISEYDGGPTTVSHVYTDAPNGYVITARAFGVFGQINAPQEHLVTVTVPESNTHQISNVVEQGDTETITHGGVSVTVIRAKTNLHDMIITLAHYQDNPVDPITDTVTSFGGVTFITTPLGTFSESISYDLRASMPEPGDVIVARFTIPAGNGAAALFFFDPTVNRYMPVRGSSKIADSFVRIGNVFQVIFDETSFPVMFQLGGTVFTITDAQPALPAVIATQPPPPPLTSADVFNSLLDTDGSPTLGSTVGVVSATQVNAFSGQNLIGAADSPENIEGRRLTGQIQLMLDAVYEQMRNVFLPQVYFVPHEAPVLPSSEEVVADAEPVWLYEEVSLTPSSRATPSEITIPVVAQPAREASAVRPWLFDERTLICLSLAALPLFASTPGRAKKHRKHPRLA